MASMVTRTIISTKAEVIFLQGDTTTTVEEVTLAGSYKKDITILHKLEKQYANAEKKPIHIKSYVEVETLYGMSEDTFLQNAVVLDPETRKPLAPVPVEATEEA